MPVRTADIAEARTQNEVRAALLAHLIGVFSNCCFLPGSYRRFPDLLPLLIIWCQMCHGKTPSLPVIMGKSRAKGELLITLTYAWTYRFSVSDRTMYLAILTL